MSDMFFRQFRLDVNKLLSEFYEYGKCFFVGVMALVLVLSGRSLAFIPIAVLFFALVVDNAFQGHERLGEWLVGFPDATPMALAAAETVGPTLALLLTVVATWRLAEDATPSDLRLIVVTGALVVALGGFGVGVDALHSVLGPNSIYARGVLGFIEDGGELVILSLLVICYSAQIAPAPPWARPAPQS